ncbi:hypothetical protein [Nocardia sp. XZ_19_231]|uniref:hypothetical protein n=1 Tax=Nocardia sp. XZ_19_231 TaxID=2769252 RepID=UPI001E3E9291|nr:hypothetical protein [Nocardia sp. XZ_19_231]
MRTIPGLRNLVLAAAAAVAATAGAVVVHVQPEDTTRKITGTADSAPGLAWSTSAAGSDEQARSSAIRGQAPNSIPSE